MIKVILRTFAILLIFFPFVSHSLERDYAYTGANIDGRDTDEWDSDGYIYYYDSFELCDQCFYKVCYGEFPSRYKKEIDTNCIPQIRGIGFSGECSVCYAPVIYSGYLHFRYKGEYPFLKRQIAYSKKYPQYQAYWPETSTKAEKISDVAIVLFNDLVASTSLKKIEHKNKFSKNFITESWYFDALECTLPISLSASCFRLSDFYQVCKDIVQFSQIYFSHDECVLIEDKTNTILDALSGMFVEMYEESLRLHPTDEIKSEIAFIELIYGLENSNIHKEKNSLNGSSRRVKINGFKNSNNRILKENPSVNNQNVLPDWLISDYWLYEGIRYNDLFLHSEAVNCLAAAIQQNPSNIEAYQERIHAYFEMGNLDLAIEDYHKLKQLENPVKEFCFDYKLEPKGAVDYSGGFCIGISKGCAVGAIEFVPSTFSCCKGILHGLWCFACSPVEVSNDLINTSYELVKFIKDNTARECLEVVIPELKELCTNWDLLSDYECGSKIGYIIGKYGVDILAPGAALKGIKKYQKLKRLNSMFTVECCVASEAKKAKILDASLKHASARMALIDAAKSGKIIPKNPNVVPHVMQKKHAWDKIIKINGNIVEDFDKVAILLEESGILSEKFLLESEKFHNGKIIRSDYRKLINGYEVQATFETYVETNQTYIKDAWVITKK